MIQILLAREHKTIECSQYVSIMTVIQLLYDTVGWNYNIWGTNSQDNMPSFQDLRSVHLLVFIFFISFFIIVCRLFSHIMFS